MDPQQSAIIVAAHYQENMLLEWGTVQELRDEFYEADSLTFLFECVRPLAIIEYLKEAGFFHLIWRVYESEIRNVKSHKPQNPDYYTIEYDKWIAENTRKCLGRLICPEGQMSSLNKLNSNPFHISRSLIHIYICVWMCVLNFKYPLP